jgi:hypothetical protein
MDPAHAAIETDVVMDLLQAPQDYGSVQLNHLTLIGDGSISAVQMNLAAGREVIR